MPCWYYEREELYKTPSYYDQIDHETETRHRREGARFLSAVSTKLNLRYDTCATAIVFFHRFYMFHSFKAFPRYVTAACCLMLAGKVEETPKKVRDIVKTARSLLSDADFEQFGNDPREEVMAFERVLLKTIKFDLQVSHPYAYLLQFAKRIKGNQEKLKELVQMSWSFINDSLATTLCLQWEPEIVACAVLYLATRMSKFTIEDWEGRQPGQRWWECFVEAVSVLCTFYSGHKLTPTEENVKLKGPYTMNHWLIGDRTWFRLIDSRFKTHQLFMSQFKQASDITGSCTNSVSQNRIHKNVPN
ncbi:unnamed protein product [Schistosoma spindalis]|nr:unnamed protein product [Schistosoma spindale]